jgi:hypothetical protein
MQQKRDHDFLYLQEDQSVNPKEYFKLAASLILEHRQAGNLDCLRLLDVGCAAGDFLKTLYQLSAVYQEDVIAGSDVIVELLNEARRRLPPVQFFEHDIGSQPLSKIAAQYDIVTMLGVHSIFDSLDWIENIVSGLSSGGIAIVYGIFNPYPYDVIVRVKPACAPECGQPGWNVHSRESIFEYCANKSINARFIDWEPDIDIAIQPVDQLRSWTIPVSPCYVQGQQPELPLELKYRRIFTNATRIIHDWAFLILSARC